jgi:uncharacterized protein YdeI (YjbR/CyaY-like superfamily)
LPAAATAFRGPESTLSTNALGGAELPAAATAFRGPGLSLSASAPGDELTLPARASGDPEFALSASAPGGAALSLAAGALREAGSLAAVAPGGREAGGGGGLSSSAEAAALASVGALTLGRTLSLASYATCYIARGKSPNLQYMERDLPVLAFPSQAAFEDWLAANHATSAGIWLQIAKKASGVDSVSYAEAVEAALCYGWIDGRKDPLDASHWLQRFTPRQARSRWSKINAEKAEQLIAAGRMQPPGVREVERAKADGRWQDAYYGQRDIAMPDDLRAALDANPKARDFFATLSGGNRYAVLYRVHDAKRPETRARRIQEFVAMLERGETLHPQRPKP